MASPDTQAEQQRRQAAALAAGGTLVVAANPPPAPSPAARASAVGKIIAALVSFLTAKRERDTLRLREELSKRAPAEDVARVIAEEARREEEFARKAAERLAGDLGTALAIPDPTLRERAVRGVLGRERTYARQRSMAMFARAIAAVDRAVLRGASPAGAFWKLDPGVIEHTAGCLVMGGKFWPWAVLDRVHPPRHAGCPCRLVGYGEAIAEGLMRAGDVMDVRTAIRAAGGVVMESAVAEALLREMDVRDRLVESGLTSPEALARIPLAGVEEG